jgi:hypothetical protein
MQSSASMAGMPETCPDCGTSVPVPVLWPVGPLREAAEQTTPALAAARGMKRWKKVLFAFAALAAAGYGYWEFAIPKHRVEITSELVMLGDLDGDHRWASSDLAVLDTLIQAPFSGPKDVAWRLDLNQNGLIDEEDVRILRALVRASGDPYTAVEMAHAAGGSFPRPRELYRYCSTSEYRSRPFWAMPFPATAESPLTCLAGLRPPASTGTYAQALDAALFSEAVRFAQAWRKREPKLLPVEREYARGKLARAEALFAAGDRFDLLLAVMDLVEDAETLTARDQPPAPLRLLAFRDHLRELIESPLYAEFAAGRQNWQAVLKAVSRHLATDLGLAYDFEKLGPPRNFTNLENYLQRAEWQYYKSSTRAKDFQALIAYAQHDPRYLRAVARTSRKLQDPRVENHNLPMILLFREAMRLVGGDKRKAVGLLDEAIRIPYAWIKSIPREALPGSLALDNFLLPGNKEDGADKSRHWNVFGGICLYKSPQEALDVALKREMQDLRDDHYTEEGMREFFRDMIANLNGMYHVTTVNPGLLDSDAGRK